MDQGSAARWRAAGPSVSPQKQRSEGLNFGSSQRNDALSPGMALVALGLDGFEHAGPGVERLPELALPGGRVGDRLRRRELVQPGAQQPVVGGRGGVARQRSGCWGVPGDAGIQSFHWSGHGGTGPAPGLGCDAGSGRGVRPLGLTLQRRQSMVRRHAVIPRQHSWPGASRRYLRLHVHRLFEWVDSPPGDRWQRPPLRPSLPE